MKNVEKSLWKSLSKGICFFVFMQNTIAQEKKKVVNEEKVMPQEKSVVIENSQLSVPKEPVKIDTKNITVTIPEVNKVTYILVKEYKQNTTNSQLLHFLSITNGIGCILVGLYLSNNKPAIINYLPKDIIKDEDYGVYTYYWFVVGGTHILYPIFNSIPLPLIHIIHIVASIWSIKDFEITPLAKLILIYLHAACGSIFLPHSNKNKRKALLNLTDNNKEIQLEVKNMLEM